MKWLRLYTEVLNDPKVQLLHPKAFKGWVNLLCMANEGTPRGRIDPAIIPYTLRIDQETADKMVAHFLERGLLEKEDDKLVPHGWDTRQFASDNVTERTREHRRNVSRNVPGNSSGNTRGNTSSNTKGTAKRTPPDTDTDTDSETETEHPQTPASGGRVRVKPEAELFAQFWALVVRKEPGRTKAQEAWDKALSRGATAEQMIEGMRQAREAYLAFEDKTKIPHVTTWLNQSRWEEPPAYPGEAPQDTAASTERVEESPEAREAREARMAARRAELAAEQAAEQERLDKIAKEATEKLQAEQTEKIREATEDPERPENVDPSIWAHIHPDRRGPYAAKARRELELQAQEAAWVAARQAEEPTA